MTELDHTARELAESRHTEALKHAQFRVLDLLSKDTSLERILSDLIRSIEGQIPGISCSILLLNEQSSRLELSVGPSLPEPFLKAIDNLEVGPEAAPCGVAAYTNQTQLVEDIATDPRCSAFVDIALRYGLRSCKPMPIRSQEGRVLGVLTPYLIGKDWPNDSLMRWIDAAVDIAGVAIERQLTRDTLRESEERFRQMAEGITDVFWLSDPDIAHIFYVSPAYEKVWGRTCESLYQDPKSFLAAVHPDDRIRVFGALEGHRQGRWNLEYRVIRPDGSIRWVRDRGFPIRDKNGKIYRIAGMASDITDRKRSEERLMQSERLAAIGEAMTGLAHESRNALQRSQAAIGRLRLKLKDDPEILKLIDEMQRAHDEIHRLYEEVRGYAAPVKLVRQGVNLKEILLKSWNDAISVRAQRIATLQQNGVKIDLCCQVDREALEQVFRNVLENSLSACRDPVELQVTWSEAEIAGQPALQVSIRDNGAGLTADAERSIFEPFYTTKTKGTGLGMTIVKRKVEAHGGEVSVGKGAGRGAEVIITLPRRPVDERRSIDSPSSALKVVIAEDEGAILEFYKEVLESLGHKVVATVKTGSQLIEKCRSERPDVAITDYRMPDINGIDAADRIWRELRVPIIIVSGSDKGELSQRLNDGHIAEYLIKPVNGKDLERAIANAVRQPRGQRSGDQQETFQKKP